VKLSVRVIAFNQARFIAQALDGVLAQRVDFEHEVVVGDDGSTDGTREILLDYQRRHPGRIRVLLADENHGGRWNFMRTLRACRGQYVALLDGDDYWTAPDKLRRQVEFLDAHPDHAISFHDALVVYEDGRREPHPHCDPTQPASSSLEDLLHGNFIPACSVVFRRDARELPAWFARVPAGDWPLHILNARQGKVGYLAEIMSVYRIHPQSLTRTFRLSEYLRGTAMMLQSVDAELGGRYAETIRATMTRQWLSTCFTSEAAERAWRARPPAQVARALEDWPAEFSLSRRQRRQLLGRACLRVAVASLRAGDSRSARAWLVGAARHDRAALREAGFWSAGIEAALGAQVAGAFRKLLRPTAIARAPEARR
jgi:glycosyltransferase involved in cell wall biosynthesis